MAEIIIKQMRFEHVDAVYEIEAKTFPYAPWSKQSFIDELNKINAYYFVAEIDEKIIGYCGMWHIINEGHINNVAVSEDCRRLGAGKKLMQALIDKALELSMIGLTLEVRISNVTAQKMYSSIGFKIEGFRKKYYEDTNEDAIIMWKLLPIDG